MPNLPKLKELQADTQANALAAHLILPNAPMPTNHPTTIFDGRTTTKYLTLKYILIE